MRRSSTECAGLWSTSGQSWATAGRSRSRSRRLGRIRARFTRIRTNLSQHRNKFGGNREDLVEVGLQVAKLRPNWQNRAELGRNRPSLFEPKPSLAKFGTNLAEPRRIGRSPPRILTKLAKSTKFETTSPTRYCYPSSSSHRLSANTCHNFRRSAGGRLRTKFGRVPSALGKVGLDMAATKPMFVEIALLRANIGRYCPISG